MTDRTKDDANKIKEVIESKEETNEIPAGYATINLSTNGYLGCAPAKFHIRNFSTESLIDLTMLEQREVPLKIQDVLDELIYEKDVSVRNFNEKEVIETLIDMYSIFYSPKISGLPYQLKDSDWKYLEETYGGKDTDEYRRSKRDYENGTWKPTFDIDLTRLHKFEITEDPKLVATIKKPNFTCKYSISKYGDYITAADYVEQKWSNKDKQYEAIGRMIQFKQDSESRWRKGENINLSSIPQVPKKEEEKFYEYQREKSKDVMRILKILHLVEVNGVDVSNLSLDEKFEKFADDPNIDFDTFKKVQASWEKRPFGIDENIKIQNPVTGKEEDYQYTFQVDTLLSSFVTNESDSTTIEFE